MYLRKREGFGKGRREINLGRRESVRMYRKYKKLSNMSLFIVRIL